MSDADIFNVLFIYFNWNFSLLQDDCLLLLDNTFRFLSMSVHNSEYLPYQLSIQYFFFFFLMSNVHYFQFTDKIGVL